MRSILTLTLLLLGLAVSTTSRAQESKPEQPAAEADKWYLGYWHGKGWLSCIEFRDTGEAYLSLMRAPWWSAAPFRVDRNRVGVCYRKTAGCFLVFEASADRKQIAIRDVVYRKSAQACEHGPGKEQGAQNMR